MNNPSIPKPEPKITSNQAAEDVIEEGIVSNRDPARTQDEIDEERADMLMRSAPTDEPVPINSTEVGKLLDREAFGQPEHGAAYNAARSAIATTIEKCDTTIGSLAQKFVPVVTITCAAAKTLDHLDNANDKRLMGDKKGAGESLFAAGREALSGNPIVQKLETVAAVIDVLPREMKDKAQPSLEEVSLAAGPGNVQPSPLPSDSFMSMLSTRVQMQDRKSLPTPFDRR